MYKYDLGWFERKRQAVWHKPSRRWVGACWRNTLYYSVKASLPVRYVTDERYVKNNIGYYRLVKK